MYTNFQASYYGKAESEPMLSKAKFWDTHHSSDRKSSLNPIMHSRYSFRLGFPKHWKMILNKFNTCCKLLQKINCSYATLMVNTISANFHHRKKKNLSYEQNRNILFHLFYLISSENVKKLIK